LRISQKYGVFIYSIEQNISMSSNSDNNEDIQDKILIIKEFAENFNNYILQFKAKYSDQND